MRIRSTKRYNELTIRDEIGKPINSQSLLVSVSGYGKSLALERLAYTYWKRGYKVIGIDTKSKPLELACSMFEPRHKYHLDLLKEQGTKTLSLPVKIFHPYVKVPLYKIPDIVNFFTIPIKDLDEDSISVLVEGKAHTEDHKLLSQGIAQLKNNEGIFELFHCLDQVTRKRVNTKEEQIFQKRGGEEVFFTRVSSSGTSSNLANLTSRLAPLLREFILAHENYSLNLDFKKLLTGDYLSIVSTAWLKNKKLKYLMIVYLINGILRNRYLTNKPILLLIQETRTLLPNTTQKDDPYIQIASEVLAYALSQVRAYRMASIGESQSFYDTNSLYRNALTHVYWGRMNVQDIERISKNVSFNRRLKNKLLSMKRMHFILSDDPEQVPYRFLMPPFMHSEEDVNFLDEFSSRLSERLVSTKGFNESYELRKREESLRGKELRAKVEEIEKKKLEEYKTIVRAKENKGRDKLVETQSSNVSEDLYKGVPKTTLEYVYDKINEGWSYSKIGRKISKNHKTVKRYFELGKEIKLFN